MLFITGLTGVEDVVDEKFPGVRGSPVEETENGVVNVLFAKVILEESEGL